MFTRPKYNIYIYKYLYFWISPYIFDLCQTGYCFKYDFFVGDKKIQICIIPVNTILLGLDYGV